MTIYRPIFPQFIFALMDIFDWEFVGYDSIYIEVNNCFRAYYFFGYRENVNINQLNDTKCSSVFQSMVKYNKKWKKRGICRSNRQKYLVL